MKKLLSLSIPLFLLACSDDAKEAPPQLRSVRFLVVQNTSVDETRTYSGAVEAGDLSRLSFQVGGRVRAVAVKVGQNVKSGQLLAELDPTDLELQLREARAGATQARIQRETTEASYQRVRRLYETNNTSRQDLDTAKAQRDTSRSQVAASAEAVRRAKRQLDYARLTAPVAGKVADVKVEANEVVSPGSPVVHLQAGDRLQIAIGVPESFVRRIAVGTKAKVAIQTFDEKTEGVVQEIGVAGSGTGVFPVTLALEDPPEEARAGMVATVELISEATEEEEDGFKLPLSAVGEDRDGRFVFLLEDVEPGVGMVKRRPVELGRIVGDGILVAKGLEVGQRVVTAGVNRIQDGMKVKVEKPGAAQ